MAKRKETPDVLADILNGGAPVVGSVFDTLRPSATNQALRQASPAPEPAEPECWDYRIVTFQDYKGWRPRYRNGQELKDWTSGPLIHDYIAQMGAEGWELAAASAGERMYGSADHHQLYFKRLNN